MTNLPQIIEDQEMSPFAQELLNQGLTPELVAKKLMETMEATAIRLDKNGEVHESIDYNSRLKAIELWAKVMKITSGSKGSLHLHQHLSGVEIDELERKAKETKRS